MYWFWFVSSSNVTETSDQAFHVVSPVITADMGVSLWFGGGGGVKWWKYIILLNQIPWFLLKLYPGWISSFVCSCQLKQWLVFFHSLGDLWLRGGGLRERGFWVRQIILTDSYIFTVTSLVRANVHLMLWDCESMTKKFKLGSWVLLELWEI